MLETLKPVPPDKIIEILNLFRADPRTDKLDLGVGVYKDADGRTPVMRSVKAAEARLLQEQDSKAYVGILGDLDFVAALGELALGAAVPRDRLAGAQTPGGTGAIRQLFELIGRANPAATVWMSDPTWPNHPAILGYLGIPDPQLPLLRRRQPRGRLRGHDGRPRRSSRRATCCCCTAAATTRRGRTSRSRSGGS